MASSPLDVAALTQSIVAAIQGAILPPSQAAAQPPPSTQPTQPPPSTQPPPLPGTQNHTGSSIPLHTTSISGRTHPAPAITQAYQSARDQFAAAIPSRITAPGLSTVGLNLDTQAVNQARLAAAHASLPVTFSGPQRRVRRRGPAINPPGLSPFRRSSAEYARKVAECVVPGTELSGLKVYTIQALVYPPKVKCRS